MSTAARAVNDAARLVDELTTLLYEVIKRWQIPDGRVCEIVRCGACRRKADRAESVVHGSDCPVYRLIRAEEANTAVIRANAEEIADLEDVRDDLEAKVNALTAEIQRLTRERDAGWAEVARVAALVLRVEAERDALAGQLAALQGRIDSAIALLDDGINACRGFDDDGKPLTEGPFPCESFCEGHGHHILREIRGALAEGA